MIDTASMGIRKVFRIQRDKYFPLPDYDTGTPQQVAVTVYGKVLNENYTRILFDHPDYALQMVFLIDQIQKGRTVSKEAVKYLRKLKVVEGRMPNIYISAAVANQIDAKEDRAKFKAFDDKYYKDMILGYIRDYGRAKRADINKLLWDKLSDNLSEKQKYDKVGNLLMRLKKSRSIIKEDNATKGAQWILRK